jgi:hypothetical protein
MKEPVKRTELQLIGAKLRELFDESLEDRNSEGRPSADAKMRLLLTRLSRVQEPIGQEDVA